MKKWRYEKGSFKGTKNDPKTGDSVTITLLDPDNIIGEDDKGKPIYATQELTWGFDENDGLSESQFKKMVKDEIKAFLKALNTDKQESNVTDDYKPQ